MFGSKIRLLILILVGEVAAVVPSATVEEECGNGHHYGGGEHGCDSEAEALVGAGVFGGLGDDEGGDVGGE